MTVYADTARLHADLLAALPDQPDLDALFAQGRASGLRITREAGAARGELETIRLRMREITADWLMAAREADAVVVVPKAEPDMPRRIGLAGYVDGIPAHYGLPRSTDDEIRAILRAHHVLPILDGVGLPLPPAARRLAELDDAIVETPAEVTSPSRQISQRRRPMSGDELRDARRILGERLGLSRPLYCSEIGAALDLTGRDLGQAVTKWEKTDGPSGPAATAIRGWLRETERGSAPPELAEAVGLDVAEERVAS
ncbi:hypothetical protein DK419_12945 [Methylobacterium terrae]|uniref:Uncharacterized protein n=1 Tax=Methylobacterium terrae TaxID=2202827 RepID=A0A2U8WLS6_9HYPH|nr:hypothetical protein [Methylobacterium terrae]AWN47107.1 hypothetical protein DK419_12945 [Methylobacterium terrae]